MKCMCIEINSNIVILEDLTMYEVFSLTEPYISGYKYLLRLLLAKATINFNEYYGDGKDTAKANFTNPTFPVVNVKGNLYWDY